MNKAKQYLKSLLLLELCRGLWLTFRYLFSSKFTLRYPEEKTPQSPRFHRYRRTELLVVSRSIPCSKHLRSVIYQVDSALPQYDRKRS